MKFKINKRLCYLIFILLPYLKPYNVTLIPALDNVFKLWKIIATLAILSEFFYYRKKIHRQSAYLLAFLLTWLISLAINKAPIIDFGNNILSIIGVLLLFETKITNPYFKKDIVNMLYKVSCIYIVLNWITVLMGKPFLSAGMELSDNANFLGGDNYSAFILIVMGGLLFLHDYQEYTKIRLKTWIFAVIGMSCLWISLSLTGLIAYTLLLLIMLFSNSTIIRTFIRKMFNWKSAMVLCVFFVLSISYFHLDKIVLNLLTSVDKVGFNGRNMIWPLAITAIMKKPVLGYGGVDASLASSWILGGTNHTHNILLEFPFSTGIVGTVFFILYWTTLLKNINIKENIREKLLLIVLAVYIICSIFDFYIGLIWFYLLLDMIWLFKEDDVTV